jgi:hypothetical protein
MHTVAKHHEQQPHPSSLLDVQTRLGLKILVTAYDGTTTLTSNRDEWVASTATTTKVHNEGSVAANG